MIPRVGSFMLRRAPLALGRRTATAGLGSLRSPDGRLNVGELGPHGTLGPVKPFAATTDQFREDVRLLIKDELERMVDDDAAQKYWAFFKKWVYSDSNFDPRSLLSIEFVDEYKSLTEDLWASADFKAKSELKRFFQIMLDITTVSNDLHPVKSIIGWFEWRPGQGKTEYVNVNIVAPNLTRMTKVARVGESIMQLSHRNMDIPLQAFDACHAVAGSENESMFAEGPMCTNCVVYVANEYLDKLPPMGPAEEFIRDGYIDPTLYRTNMRFGCMLPFTKAMDGITFAIPDRVPTQEA